MICCGKIMRLIESVGGAGMPAQSRYKCDDCGAVSSWWLDDERAFPTDPLGAWDHGYREPIAKPCCKRLNSIPQSYCQLIDGHAGPCHAEPMRAVETEELGPKYKMRMHR